MKTSTIIMVVAGIAAVGIGAYFFLQRRSSMSGSIRSNVAKQHINDGAPPPPPEVFSGTARKGPGHF